MAPHVSRATWIVLAAALIAAAAKLYCAWTTFGTTDVYLFYIYGKNVIDHGLEATYATPLFNHTPLVASYFTSILALSEASGIPFAFLFKLPCIIADFLVVLILLQAGAGRPGTAWLALFALSPVSFMVSGYHGNIDPVMVLFLVLAAWMCVKNHHLLCGLCLGLACNFKIISLLLTPVFFFYWLHRGKAVRFTAVTILTCLVGWSQPLILYPRVFIRNVFGYSGYWGEWGITYWLRATHSPRFEPVTWLNTTPSQHFVVSLLKILVICGILLLAWRRRAAPDRAIFATIAYAWTIFFIFSPGVGVQYLVWLAPFVLFASPYWYAALTAASTAYLFVFYNVISHGMPWHHGVSTNQLIPLWVAWTNLPWAVLIVGAAVLSWRGIRSRRHPVSRGNPSPA